MEDYNEALQTLYKKYAVFAAFADWAADRKRGQRTTTVSALRNKLGKDVNEKEAVQLLEQLGQYGLGTYHRSRPLKNSRIQWNRGCSIIDVARAMRGDEHIDFNILQEARAATPKRIRKSGPMPGDEVDEADVWETGISLEDAKQLLATFYDVSEDAVEIVIRA